MSLIMRKLAMYEKNCRIKDEKILIEKGYVDNPNGEKIRKQIIGVLNQLNYSYQI